MPLKLPTSRLPTHPATPDAGDGLFPQESPAPAAPSPKPAGHPGADAAASVLPFSISATTEGQAIALAVLDQIDASTVPTDRARLEPLIAGIVAEVANARRSGLSATEQGRLAREICDDIVGLGPLDQLLADKAISEIMVNGPNRIFIERHGDMILTDACFRDEKHLRDVAVRIARHVGRRVDDANPRCDARLADGSRVKIVLSPISLDGTSITIRKFPDTHFRLEDLVAMGALTRRMARFLSIAVQSKASTIISGGTGSGKTTILRALAEFIDHRERIITIEDAAELNLQKPNIVRLETRPASAETGGAPAITIRDLVVDSLRMKPKRIIVGECRGPEAFDMLTAFGTGHDGSMSTLHANGVREAMSRMANMYMMAFPIDMRAIKAQIVTAVDMVIQIEQSPDGKRRVTNISEVCGMDGDVIQMQELFRFVGFEGAEARIPGSLIEDGYLFSGLRPRLLEKAQKYGLAGKMAEALGIAR